MTTGTLTFWDGAYPPENPPEADGACFYLPGGDAYHAWTGAEVAALRTRYRLPVFVRSNPPGPGAAADVAAAVAALKALGAPRGSLVAWDSETSADAAYIRQVYTGLAVAGYKLIVYGTQADVFGNQSPDGLYFGADWTGVPHIAAGDAMTQYATFGGYDESLASSSLPFWDTAPHLVPPAPAGGGGTPWVFADLAWDPVPGASHYRYQVAHGTPARPGAVVATAVVPGMHAEGVKLGQPGPYCWRVQAGGGLWTAWRQLEAA